MEIRPAFYDEFQCLADRCRHTCCRGWEIDVDEDTRRLYLGLEGPLGEALRAALRQVDGAWAIRFNEAGNCPLLREDGLCRVILELGEEALCDICALHPRFFEDIGEYELDGVGLCCEAAAALLLDWPGELLFLTEKNEVMDLAGLLEMLGLPVDEAELDYVPRGAEDQAMFQRYGRCEAIDVAWSESLAALTAAREENVRRAAEYAQSCDREAFQRIFNYILYRQLERADTYGLPALIRYAREGTDFVLLWTAVSGDLPERLRRWSAEMEYSEENVAFLLESHAGEK